MAQVNLDDDRKVQRTRVAFGITVREFRHLIGINQGEMAARANVDRQSVNRVENARYSLIGDRMWGYAAALDVPLSQIVLRAEELLAGRTQCPRLYLGRFRCMLPDTKRHHTDGRHAVSEEGVNPSWWRIDKADELRWKDQRRISLAPGAWRAVSMPDDARNPAAATSGTAKPARSGAEAL